MTYELNHTAGPTLKVPLVFSLAFHSLLFGSLIVSTLLSHRGETWGGPGGGAMTVGLVGHLPGVPLPRPEAITPSRVVDETKAIHPQREIEFETRGDLTGRWDSPRLEQVVSNLLGNAVHHGQGRILDLIFRERKRLPRDIAYTRGKGASVRRDRRDTSLPAAKDTQRIIAVVRTAVA